MEYINKLLTKYKRWLLFGVLLFVALIIRLFLTRFGNFGDVAIFAELGDKFWKINLHDFYSNRNYYYTYPAYPPLSYYIIALSYWLYDKRYILAEIHNIIKVIPADFIIYFSKPVEKDPLLYGYGYYLLLKLPSILFDLGISVLVYRIIYKVTQNYKRAIYGFIFYLFNPLTIFLTSVWGQNDAVAIFLGMFSIYLLFSKRISVSIWLLFLSVYTKPTFIIFAPIYLVIFLKLKPQFKNIFLGVIFSAFSFLILTYPFSGSNYLDFTKKMLFENILPGSRGVVRASVSAFNLYSALFTIDKTQTTFKLLNIPLGLMGIVFFILINLFVIKRFLLNFKLENILFSLYIVGLGNFFFNTGMLERYFFPAFPFLVILIFIWQKIPIYLIGINIILFLNLIWAFFRRSVGVIDHLFSDYDFLFIRLLSFANIIFWYFSIKNLLSGKIVYGSRKVIKF